MPKKVLFVVNHKAGNNARADLKECIIKHEEVYQYSSYIHILNDNPLEGIKKAIESFEPDIVAAIGGDGTVNLVTQAIKNTAIQLIIVPYGSANGMAKEFNMPVIVEDCLKLIKEGRTIEIDLLEINNHISVHLADVGLNARIVKRFQLDNKRGLLTYGKYLLNEIFFIRKKTFTLFLEGRTRRIKAVSITFANATKYGTGAVINPHGKLDDGLFELCIVKPFPKFHIFSIALQMFRNRLNYSEYFETLHCKFATLKTKTPTLLQVDGEIIGKVKEINLNILPKALQVIIPNHLDYPTLVN